MPMEIVLFTPGSRPPNAALLAALDSATPSITIVRGKTVVENLFNYSSRVLFIFDLRGGDSEEFLLASRLIRENPSTRTLVLRSSAEGNTPTGDGLLTEPFYMEEVVQWCLRAMGAPPDDGIINDFAAGLAHEVLNPLTSMLMQIQLLKEDDSGKNVLSQLDVIEASGQRIRRVVDDVTLASERRPIDETTSILLAGLLHTARKVLAQRDTQIADAVELSSRSLRVQADARMIIDAFTQIWTFLKAAGKEDDRIEVRANALDNDTVSIRISTPVPRLPHDAGSRLFTPLWARQALGLPDDGPSLTSARTTFRRHQGDLLVRSHRDGILVLEALLPRVHEPQNGKGP